MTTIIQPTCGRPTLSWCPAIWNSITNKKGMCSFCEERPSAGAVTLWFDRSSCEICGPCMKRYCWAHGKAPLKNGFICHLCCTARWCANENCDQFFRAPISQKYCEKCVDSAEACLVG